MLHRRFGRLARAASSAVLLVGLVGAAVPGASVTAQQPTPSLEAARAFLGRVPGLKVEQLSIFPDAVGDTEGADASGCPVESDDSLPGRAVAACEDLYALLLWVGAGEAAAAPEGDDWGLLMSLFLFPGPAEVREVDEEFGDTVNFIEEALIAQVEGANIRMAVPSAGMVS